MKYYQLKFVKSHLVVACSAKETKTFSAHTAELHGVPAVVGQFSNFGFPYGYSSSGDIFAYYLRNLDPSGHVRLTFEDWNLSPYSWITVNMTECRLLTYLFR